MKGNLSKIKLDGLVLLSCKSESAHDVLEFGNRIWISKQWLLEYLDRG